MISIQLPNPIQPINPFTYLLINLCGSLTWCQALGKGWIRGHEERGVECLWAIQGHSANIKQIEDQKESLFLQKQKQKKSLMRYNRYIFFKLCMASVYNLMSPIICTHPWHHHHRVIDVSISESFPVSLRCVSILFFDYCLTVKVSWERKQGMEWPGDFISFQTYPASKPFLELGSHIHPGFQGSLNIRSTLLIIFKEHNKVLLTWL